MTVEGPPVEAVRLLNGFRGYQLAVAACRLKLPDLVAAGIGEAEALATQTGTHEPSLRRVLRGLAAWGFFAEGQDGRFRPTAVSNAFRSDRPGLRNMTLMLSHEAYESWGELMHALQDGQPVFERLYGKSRWEKMAEDPEDAAHFNAAMVETTKRVGKSFIAAYDFRGIRTVVDVGGGNGALLAAVLGAHPELNGVLFDLPAGLAGAESALKSAGVAGRARVVEGSFFESVPSGSDLYLLKSIVHDWDDEHALKILQACRTAMGPDARLVVVERLLPETGVDGDHALGTLMSDLHMMVVLGGQERTTAEYASLFAQAGLRMTHPIAMASDFYAIEAVPV